ncbi:hypothetical protein BG015_001789 [Linnemannia schmuckeri]|uniref:Uncharacterized protein n=1 Tax=Linnemannia schmuckeri TaxID=64567 RepID=A0A9P5RS22_9FUNG|nr:hypothetical protein BG015_001789 [Linnemannia schmuckeri]
MTSLFTPTTPQNPPQHTFLDKKPPLLPRQSTSDVLSFTHIIADRLLPGQNVWDYFSPPPVPIAPPSDDTIGCSSNNSSNNALANAALPPLSPTSSGPQAVSMAAMMMSPASPVSPTFGQFPAGSSEGGEGGGRAVTESSSSKRNSIVSSIVQERTDHSRSDMPESNNNSNSNNNHKADPSLSSLSNNNASSSVSPSSPSATTAATTATTTNVPLPPAPPLVAPTSTAWSTATAVATTTSSTTASTSGSNDNNSGSTSEMETPKLHKRRSFAQSLKHGMLSLTQLLSPSSSVNSSRLSSPMANSTFAIASTAASAATTGPPHYNILVLGSDSAPLASTLYKMSGLLPSATKIRHYQEISGFFVAYFRSNGSFSCSPTMTPTTPTTPTMPAVARVSTSSAAADALVLIEREGIDEVKSRRGSIQDSENDDLAETRTLSQPSEEGGDEMEAEEDPIMKLISARSSEETLLQLKISFGGEGGGGKGDGLSSSGGSTAHSVADMDREEILLSDNDEGDQSIDTKSSTEGCDTELEPKTETETEEPLNASANASLSVHAFSLDTTWPVPRTLAQTFWFPHAHGIIYIVDATRKNDPRGIDHLLSARQFLASLIADPHFKRKDIPVVVFANKAGLDPETCYRVDEIADILGCEDWDLGAGCDSEGKGRRSSGETPSSAAAGKGLVEGELVEVDASEVVKTRPWCVKSTRCDGAGDGLRESVEWLKSRMSETWRP